MAIRYKTLLVLLLTGVAVYLGVANVSDRVIWQQVSDGVEWAESRQGLEVRSLVTEGEGPDLAPGDVLISVQGIPVGGIDDLTEIREFLAVSLPSGTPANYEVQKMGLGLVRVEVPLLRQQQLSSTDILLSLIAFTYLGIGLIIFLRNFEASGAFHFFVVCLLAFVVFLYRHSGRADTFDILIYWVNTTAFLLLPAAFVQFCLLFPERRDGWIARHNTKLAVYLPACFLILLHAWWFTGWMQGIGLPRNTAVSGILDRLHLGHFLTLFVLGSLVLVMARRRASSSLHRQRMKWITRGTVLGVAPMAVFYGIPFLLGWETSPLMQASSMSLVVIPLAFGYAISSYRLMDVDVIFKRGMAYLIASSALVGLYVAIVMAIGQALQKPGRGKQFHPVCGRGSVGGISLCTAQESDPRTDRPDFLSRAVRLSAIFLGIRANPDDGDQCRPSERADLRTDETDSCSDLSGRFSCGTRKGAAASRPTVEWAFRAEKG